MRPHRRHQPLGPERFGARTVLCGALLGILLLAAGCGSDNRDEVRVMAASSLSDVFADLTADFADTAAGADITVTLTFAGSPTLARQLEEGAPADVVAVADEASMARISDGLELDDSPTIFASNQLILATPADNPAEVSALGDLQRGDILVAVCAPEVPCGALTADVTAAAEVELQPATFEPSVRSVLAKVELGEVDAGLVYRTDVIGRDVLSFAIPTTGGESTGALTNRYPIAALSEAGRAFVDFVLSPAGQAVLEAHGFGPGTA